jgi:hypothetical protein
MDLPLLHARQVPFVAHVYPGSYRARAVRIALELGLVHTYDVLKKIKNSVHE